MGDLSARAFAIGQLYDEALAIVETTTLDVAAMELYRATEVAAASVSFRFAMEKLANAIREYRATREEKADA